MDKSGHFFEDFKQRRSSGSLQEWGREYWSRDPRENGVLGIFVEFHGRGINFDGSFYPSCRRTRDCWF